MTEFPARGTPSDVEVLILAGGHGERLGLGPKGFVRLGGLTLLERAVAAAGTLEAPIIVAVPASHVGQARAMCAGLATVIEGGASRSESMRRLLARSRAPMLVVHDVAHPLARAELFPAVVSAAQETGVAITALRPTDFVYRELDSDDAVPGSIAERVDEAWIAQSPRAMLRGLLEAGLAAHDTRSSVAESPAVDVGSLDLVGLAGGRVVTVPGDVRNIKITTRHDLETAELLLADQPLPEQAF